MRSSRLRLIAILLLMLVGSGVATIEAHRSGCHRWHACPSDHGTYVCGDLGYCSQCQDHAYGQGGQPNATTKPPAKPEASAPTPSPRPRT
jgi:hypothetical protein